MIKRARFVNRTGCLIVLLFAFVLIGWNLVRLEEPTRREPEIQVHRLLEKQLDVFPPDWTTSGGYTTTDKDSSWAYWAHLVGFKYKRGLKFATEDILVFENPFAGRILGVSTKPLSHGKEDRFVPQEWTYPPPYADQFEIRCGGEEGLDEVEACSVYLRYEEYVIVFWTPIGEMMSLNDLQRILEVTDKEMYDFLQSSIVLPGRRSIPASAVK